ncbi:MAG: 50S ribosomal protein L10 [Acidimicrobiia bacterium]|nr:50S ribosomal protein L10 [Acidimicrobiia bacterium]
MDNPRPEKVAIVTEVKERLENATSVVVTEYRGLTVSEMQELRGQLRPSGARYKVYKNTLVRRAADEAGLELADHLVGPTALAFAEPPEGEERGDVVSMAKALRDFAKAHPNLIIKGGLFDGEPIDADGITALADIEPREVLLAKLAGLMAAPMQQFASLLQAVPREFAGLLQALIDEGGAPGAPAEAAESDPEPEVASATSSDEAPEGADESPTPESDGDSEDAVADSEEAGEEE